MERGGGEGGEGKGGEKGERDGIKGRWSGSIRGGRWGEKLMEEPGGGEG